MAVAAERWNWGGIVNFDSEPGISEVLTCCCCSCCCCCFLLVAATAAAVVADAAAAAAATAAAFDGVEPFSTLCCVLGDMMPGDVRLLTMEYVGDTLFVIELLMVDVDVVDKLLLLLLLFVMEVRIAWLSIEFDDTDDGTTLGADDTLCCSDCS